MKKILASWLFFTALMLFLIAAAVTIPGWMDRFLGSTQSQITETADYLREEAQAVWAEFIP